MVLSAHAVHGQAAVNVELDVDEVLAPVASDVV
jgi:hypothetical protein